MHRAPILASVAAAALLGICSTAAAQQGQDLDKMLNSIPTVQTQPDPAAAAAAEEEARRKADEEGSLPAYVEACQKLAFDAWAPSKGILKKHPATKTSFLVSVGADGSIQTVKAGVLSGDKKLDQSALDAIAAVPKFPVPAPSLAFEVERGVVIELSTKAANKRAAAK